MKKIVIISILLCFFFQSFAQNDTVYVMKNGVIISQRPVNQIDSIIFYRPTLPINFFTDPRDNHVYSIININGVNWMGENLAYLPSVVGPLYGSQSNPLYYVFQYNGTDTIAAKATSNYQTYGVLYNWSAAMNVCPSGWHLPSDAEFTSLSNYLGGDNVTGGKLKEFGTIHWSSPNIGATDEIGFRAIPGSNRLIDGSFNPPGMYCYFWTSTEYTSNTAYGRGIYNNSIVFDRNHHYKDYAHSVRCIQN